MPKNLKTPTDDRGAIKPAESEPSLADVIAAVDASHSLTDTRKRDLRSAVKRVAVFLDGTPANIALELSVISVKLRAISPAAVGVIDKTLSNIRADFMAAVEASGLKPVQRAATADLNPVWQAFYAKLDSKCSRIGLSRLVHYLSAADVLPDAVNNAFYNDFMTGVRDGTLAKKVNPMLRKTAQIWNEAAGRMSDFNLQTLEVPSFRPEPKRVTWDSLSPAFHTDVDQHLAWCAGVDVFAADARFRPLAARSVKLRRNYIHAAVSALIDSGMAASGVVSLADLLNVEAFTKILKRRYVLVNRAENQFNKDMAKGLVSIAREWCKPNQATLNELQRLVGKIPAPVSGLTPKNKAFLRQFDDDDALIRLVGLPQLLWNEVKREKLPDFRTLAKAQAALALGILTSMPIRTQNLIALEFGVHLFLVPGPRATSSLELCAGEVKNDRDIAFDIPAPLVKMLFEYRDEIAPKILGHKPLRLFSKVDGSAKAQASVSWLIRTYLQRRAGLKMSGHQFRHLAVDVLLKDNPGAFETARQMLGHRNLKTTVNSYSELNSRRAGRHHQELLNMAVEKRSLAGKPGAKKKRAKPNGEK
jgi:integrase